MTQLDVPSTCQIEGYAHILTGYFGDLLADPRGAAFVDIGAHDGITHSNTWPLAVAGWQGICVEADQEMYGRCIGNHQKHPDVKVIHGAVGKYDDVLTMFTDGKDLRTMDVELAEALGANMAVGNMRTITLDGIMLESGFLQGFELLSIDVEGLEMDVLEGFSVHYWMPAMIIVEAHETHHLEALRRNSGDINKYMAEANYKRIYCDNINSIYIRRS